MICPRCNVKSRVVNSYRLKTKVVRRRVCESCGLTWQTTEWFATEAEAVREKTGREGKAADAATGNGRSDGS